MIYATLNYEGDYSSQHHLLLRHLAANFADVEEGLQSDSWIWVFEGGQKVAVDSFTSMKHEVKAKPADSDLAKKVIEVLEKHYDVTCVEPPEAEAHD